MFSPRFKNFLKHLFFLFFPVTDHWKFLCAGLLLFGLFVCFFGHKYFRITLFIIGFTFGIFITYLMISQEEDFTTKGKLVNNKNFAITNGTAKNIRGPK